MILQKNPYDVFEGKIDIKALNAINGDFVKFSKKGLIFKVIKRKNKNYIGILHILPNDNGVFSTNKLHVDIFIPKEQLNGAKNHEKVYVKFLDWSEKNYNTIGKIIKVIGKSGEIDTEIDSIILEYDLKKKFTQKVEFEASQIFQTITEKEIYKRRDLRDVITFTIDPENAKDFDDAISIQSLGKDFFEIGVHIADVSHYVSEGSNLDKEAYKRATSVYLLNKVIPMFPEIISNKLCSLRPLEEKLCLSVIFQMNKRGKIFNFWLGKTVIRSNIRFTYEEAQKCIENKKGYFFEELIQINYLAKKLKKERLEKGSIIFEKIEIKFLLNQKNDPINFFWEKILPTHQVIEEFMLLTNRKIAEFINYFNKKYTYIYRVHDNPDKKKICHLKKIYKFLGYEFVLENSFTITKSLNLLIKAFNDKPLKNIFYSIIMSTLSKAKYSTKNIGHYGLAFKYYTHFTSPIRRYPDIIAHRLLKHYLDGGDNVEKIDFESKCRYASSREKLALDAERDSIKYMQIKYIEKNIGNILEGIISSLTEWGIYIVLEIVPVEGFVRLRDIKNDIYIFNNDKFCVEGKKYKKRYFLGNEVKVKLLNVSFEKKKIQLQFIDNNAIC